MSEEEKKKKRKNSKVKAEVGVSYACALHRGFPQWVSNSNIFLLEFSKLRKDRDSKYELREKDPSYLLHSYVSQFHH